MTALQEGSKRPSSRTLEKPGWQNHGLSSAWLQSGWS